MNKFPHYTQPDSRDCGPTWLRMVAMSERRNYLPTYLSWKSNIMIHKRVSG